MLVDNHWSFSLGCFMDDVIVGQILKKLKAELAPECRLDDWEFDFGFELGIEKAIDIIKEATGYDIRESGGDSRS